MKHILTLLEEKHLPEMLEILNYYILNDFSAFYEEPLTEEVTGHILQAIGNNPALVVLNDSEKVIGFSFIHNYQPMPVFKHTGMVTYFIHPHYTRQGLGSLMLNNLLALAKSKGFEQVLACVSSKNPRSVAFHEKHGFKKVGLFPSVGRKLGQDFDVIYFYLDL